MSSRLESFLADLEETPGKSWVVHGGSSFEVKVEGPTQVAALGSTRHQHHQDTGSGVCLC